MSNFVHLHCHTEFSLLDGAISIEKLCKKAKDLDMQHIAITDHGNMHGALIFYQAAKKAGLNPIIGCEVYIAKNSRFEKKSKSDTYHLVLLAKNENGYKNLCRLVSYSNIDGFYYKPRIDKELLREYGQDIIALSACLGGEIPQALMQNNLELAKSLALEYAELFPDNFYLEIQDNGIAEQYVVNEQLIKLAQETNLPLVATNDCHYLNNGDHEAHEILLCVQTQTTIHDEKRMRMGTDQLYYKSPEEMTKAFAHVPEAISNTIKIAEQCQIEINLTEHYFPKYDLPEGSTIDSEFDRLCREGLAKRIENVPYKIDEQVYLDRLDYELKVITDMQFPAYFLIVQDFINWAKSNNIPVGPGRGSAAGSIVAWALRITNIDPIPYDLLFERFLNTERVSLPDIDVDFCERRRIDVIKYCMDKYGEDYLAQITTFGTMKAKGVIRDVGRATGMTFQETDKIAKLIPDELKMTIEKALTVEPQLYNLYEADPQIKKLLDVCKKLEGLSRHASTHAAGVVLSPLPMMEYLPVYKSKKGEVETLVTQYDMKYVEKVGLIKFDFLGLRTITVIQDCLDIIREQGKDVPDLDTLTVNDVDTYKIFARGETDGIFQVESAGMRKYLRMLRPNCFEDIIAMLALYRPGPLGMGMVEEFIKRKHGETEVSYPHPSLEEILKPTYGVMVYQEQVMSTARIIANYSLGEGDLLRRAMGKKDAVEMANQRARFLAGAKENEIAEKIANEIFDTMEKFAEYGFNKSHSAAYALISYQTAYLKAHFPLEFMAAIISSELNNTDKVYTYINTCKDMGITVSPPNINHGRGRFSVQDGCILFGLGSIKNVSEEALKDVVREREENGSFENLVDFCNRTAHFKVSKRQLEYLIKSGAMDIFECSRCGLMASLDKVVANAQRSIKEKESGMLSMLSLMTAKDGEDFSQNTNMPEEASCKEWDEKEKLIFEKEALGFYLSSHPLTKYRYDIKRLSSISIASIKELQHETQGSVPVIITSLSEKITRNGKKMAIAQIEDLTGSGELVIFPKAWIEYSAYFAEERPLWITGRLGQEVADDEENSKQAKIILEDVIWFDDKLRRDTTPIELQCLAENCSDEILLELKTLLKQYPGKCPLHMTMQLENTLCTLGFDDEYKVQATGDFWESFTDLQKQLMQSA